MSVNLCDHREHKLEREFTPEFFEEKRMGLMKGATIGSIRYSGLGACTYFYNYGSQ